MRHQKIFCAFCKRSDGNDVGSSSEDKWLRVHLVTDRDRKTFFCDPSCYYKKMKRLLRENFTMPSVEHQLYLRRIAPTAAWRFPRWFVPPERPAIFCASSDDDDEEIESENESIASSYTSYGSVVSDSSSSYYSSSSEYE